MKKENKVKDIALMGMMTATLEAGKMAFAGVPNVEIVTLLLILYALTFGRRAIFAAVGMSLLECFFWGFGIWTIMYLYIWPLLVLGTLFFYKIDSKWFWSLFSGLFGLMFGALCSIIYLFFGGPKTAFGWWVAGIPWDLMHGASNFVVMMILYQPLRKVLGRFARSEITGDI